MYIYIYNIYIHMHVYTARIGSACTRDASNSLQFTEDDDLLENHDHEVDEVMLRRVCGSSNTDEAALQASQMYLTPTHQEQATHIQLSTSTYTIQQKKEK